MQARLGGALVALMVSAASVQAQTTLDQLDCPAEPVRIAVLGDSLADGLWGSFYRAFASCDSVEVLRRATVSDGLAGSDPDEWLDRLAGDGALDLVVVQIGANDITNIREGTTRHVFGDPSWGETYGARVEELSAGLQDIAPEVIWMGLPIVGRAQFEDGYQAISAVQAEAAERAGVRFVDTHTPTTFGQGAFVMSAEVDGSVRQIRATDQVHFTEIGYDMVAALLHGDVEKLFDDRSRAVAIDALQLQ